MIEEKQTIFSDFMNEFVKLDIKQKNNEVIEKQKIILAHLIKYAYEHEIEFELFKSNEIKDLSTNEDYLESIMVYMQNIEELIGLILSAQ